jgi:hypothetical protein
MVRAIVFLASPSHPRSRRSCFANPDGSSPYMVTNGAVTVREIGVKPPRLGIYLDTAPTGVEGENRSSPCDPDECACAACIRCERDAQGKRKRIKFASLRAARTMVRAIHLFKTRHEDTHRILSKFLGTNDPEALEESWNYGADMPAKPFAVESAVQAELTICRQASRNSPNTNRPNLSNPLPLAELDRSGYIDRPYAGRRQRASKSPLVPSLQGWYFFFLK